MGRPRHTLYAGVALALLAAILPGDSKEKKQQNTPPSQSAKPAATYAAKTTHPAAYTAPQHTGTANTQQHPMQSAPKTSPKPTASNRDGLIAKDFITAVPHALKGLLIGFVLFCVFAFFASLTMAHNITNVFAFLAAASLFCCPIVTYAKSLKQQPKIRNAKAERKAAAQHLEQQILDAFHTLDTVSTSTKEGTERYGKACDFLVYAFSPYYSIPECTEVAKKHRHKCYERTHPYYAWNSRTFQYEYVPGTELAEEVLQARRLATEERESLYNKK